MVKEMWILEYYRHLSLEKYEAETKEEALNFGFYGEEDGRLLMSRLISPDGKVAMDRVKLSDYHPTNAKRG